MTQDAEHAALPSSPSAETRLPSGASALVEVDIAGLSDPGRVRANNEDHFFVGSFHRGMRTLATNVPQEAMPRSYEETVYAMLVADGVGGSAAGEIASRTAVQALVDLVLETPDWIMLIDDRLADEALHRMERRFQKVRDTLIARANADPSLKGMGTTMTVAGTIGPELLTAHVGDSRAYVLRRDGRLERLTRDQTMAQSLADSGAIRQDEVEKSPYRHVLTSALATRGTFVQVELKRARLEDGDRVLLCSDGLTDMIPDPEIARILSKAGSSAEGCRSLVDYSLEAGGKDNVTVVLARYRIPRDARSS
ncbi:MAG TPA: protein phosphatase 2C domain-containing protein [Thermoanaerobaculia bacterium]|nr:protein phosphatase 2C domain-containing protein [Thermoanaerobaculia bacterium]